MSGDGGDFEKKRDRQLSSMDLGIVMGFAAWLMNHDLYGIRENVPI